MKLTKHKIDCRWEHGTPLRAKSKSPIDHDQPTPTPTPEFRRRKTIDSTYECKLLQQRLLTRRGSHVKEDKDNFQLRGAASTSMPSKNPKILVNGLEKNVHKCQVDFRNLFALLGKMKMKVEKYAAVQKLRNGKVERNGRGV